jgi:drug/metabolite transporter (DMT)-like permease
MAARGQWDLYNGIYAICISGAFLHAVGRVMSKNESNSNLIVASLLFAVFLWGANNAGTKYMVQSWPPVFVGATRFLAAGILFSALLRWTGLFGQRHVIGAEMSRKLWVRCGLTLGVYIIVFNWALKLTAASHVVLYLGAAPVWALLWEGRPEKSWRSVQRYAAAVLALSGVCVLIWPVLRANTAHTSLAGEVLGLACSILWTLYGRMCRSVASELSGAEISAQSFWRAGVVLIPMAVIEFWTQPVAIPVTAKLLGVQSFCVLGGGIAAFALWNSALRHWTTSKVYLFNNLIPLSTMTWAYFFLDEPITKTFWMALVLIASGVILGQANWQKLIDLAVKRPA